ncbi:aryl-alcohol oxidase-like protein [Mycena alexandri]|uniref:Aryl-alcohol oxidase-like protein n=1 Tax=Mycena alexandri TaxID=1745969 RepID=A0AAD6WPB2_9AGAR|nr:aryl-alcohol oxidase-like protein [Mycena alexandri]
MPLCLLFLLLLAPHCLGSVFTAPEQLTSTKYDFIVVGAGTAGCVVASRLSENPTVKVLVIEAGVADNTTEADLINIPFLAGQGIGTTIDWNYTTTNQAGLNGRAIPYPRGFVMGGSSSINSMIYFRGPSEDFDRLAAASGDPGWSWENLQRFIFMNERHVAPWNNRSNAGEYDPRAHGHGPLLSSVTADPFELDRRVIQTLSDHPEKYPFNMDLNSGNGLGFGWIQSTVGNGVRSSASRAYLHPALDSRTNIDLLLHTQVTRLISTGAAGSTFTSVEVAQSAGATKFEFTATKEVILSAGSIGTPQILMLSGIGPKNELEALGIISRIDLPDVGANLQDQTILSLQWEAKVETLSSFLSDPAAVNAALAQWTENKTGIAAGTSLVNTIGFLRLPEDSPLLKSGDPAAGSNSAHFEFAFLNTFLPNADQPAPLTGNWVSAAVTLQSPTSRGSLKLRSRSAFEHPIIDPAFYTTSFDIGTVVHAVKALREFFSASAWDGFLGSPFPAVAALNTDEAIEAYARTWATTVKHPVSTAKISKIADKAGVVSPNLLLKGGANGVRVVDASIFPFAVAGYPQAEVYIVAERAAALIKETWSLK